MLIAHFLFPVMYFTFHNRVSSSSIAIVFKLSIKWAIDGVGIEESSRVLERGSVYGVATDACQHMFQF